MGLDSRIVTRPHCFTKPNVHNQKKHTTCYAFSTCLFSFFFQTKCSSLFLPLDCDLCKPQLQAGSIGIDFSKQFFPFKKTSCSQKKREFLIFFSKPKFFCHLFPFRQKEKTEDEKYHTRTTLPRAIFSLFFVFQNMVARWRFLLVPGNSQFVIKAHSKFIYNTSGCNCIKTNTFKALNKNHNRGHILDVLRVLG